MRHAEYVPWLDPCLCSVAQDGEFEKLKRLYDYDPQQSLDIQQKLLHERGKVKVYDLSYASRKEAASRPTWWWPRARGHPPGGLRPLGTW